MDVEGAPVGRVSSVMVVLPAPAEQPIPWAIPPGVPVVAVDSGLDTALRWGWSVHHLIGDLDSVSEAGLEVARSRGIGIHQAPTDKDQTDLELAVAWIVQHWPTVERLVVVGGVGGRLDHELAGLAVLAAASERVRIELVSASSVVHFCRDRLSLDLPIGATLSLLAWHGDAEGVSVTNTRWPLDDERLPAGSARGTSNLVTGSPVLVTVRSGVVSVTVLDPSATSLFDQEARPAAPVAHHESHHEGDME